MLAGLLATLGSLLSCLVRARYLAKAISQGQVSSMPRAHEARSRASPLKKNAPSPAPSLSPPPLPARARQVCQAWPGAPGAPHRRLLRRVRAREMQRESVRPGTGAVRGRRQFGRGSGIAPCSCLLRSEFYVHSLARLARAISQAPDDAPVQAALIIVVAFERVPSSQMEQWNAI